MAKAASTGWKPTPKDPMEECEGHIRWAREQVIKHMNEIGKILLEMKENKWWHPKYKSFADYCKDEWSFTQGRAYQLLKGEKIRALLLETVAPEMEKVVKKLNEAKLRELAKIKEEEAAKLLEELHEETGGDFTAQDIQNKINHGKVDVLKPEKKVLLCPHCKVHVSPDELVPEPEPEPIEEIEIPG